MWEVLFGINRETAQLLNLSLASVVFISSGVYLVTGQLHESKAALQVVASTANAASHDVRALISNAQRACREQRCAPAQRASASPLAG